jgi:hypothetical protein
MSNRTGSATFARLARTRRRFFMGLIRLRKINRSGPSGIGRHNSGVGGPV